LTASSNHSSKPKFEKKATFVRDFQALPDNIKQACRDALARFAENPRANSLRMHALTGYSDPKVFTIDVTPNKAYKISFEYGDSGAVVLRRVRTHKEIDRAP
jgi:hypothetical protein